MYIQSFVVRIDAPANREPVLDVINHTVLPDLREHHTLREATIFEAKQSLVTVMVFESEPATSLNLLQRLVDAGTPVTADQLVERTHPFIAAA